MASIYDLEERTLTFARTVMAFCKSLSLTQFNRNIISQLLRSSSSIGANYIEANEALGKKDFLHKVRISRKEAKETCFWLKLLTDSEPREEDKINQLYREVVEIRNILSAILKKSSSSL